MTVTPLTATEAVWLKDLFSRVKGSVEELADLYTPEVHARAVTLCNRFETQPKISDTALAGLLDELCEYLDASAPSPRAAAVYFKEMCEWPEQAVYDAFEKAKQNWRFKKLPLIADFKRWVQWDLAERSEAQLEATYTKRRLDFAKKVHARKVETDARRAKKSAAAHARLAEMDPIEREEAVRKTCPPDVADRILSKFAD